ncbi:MAG: hypothetical protein IKP39_03375 [Paludibacteraceae bacterium]|nr:hypothetical protein [Paludibacteraceae bacterium]
MIKSPKKMNLLLVLLSVMTITVETKSSVSMDGEWPYDIDVSYSNSYQKGDVRSGDVAELKLSHLEGVVVEKVEVYVKSNKNGGGGTFTLTADGEPISTISGTFNEWFGAYDNTDYHPIELLDSPVSLDELVISLEGSENSLHIEKYVITHTSQPAWTVTLMKGAEVYGTMTEPSGGQGIMLPSLAPQGQWHFVGWTMWEFWTIYTMPNILPSSSRFYPDQDCTLWAVYEYQPVEMVYAEDLVSGEYLYVNRTTGQALSGVPEDGVMWAATTNNEDPDQIYYIDFASADTAYITHEATGTPIGYSGLQMVAKPSPWLVYRDGKETIFYMEQGGKKYVLWLNVWDSYSSTYAGLLEARNLSSPMALMPAGPSMEEPAFTCHPECGLGVEEVKGEEVKGERVVRFGIYELHIVNGEKRLVISR